MSCSRELGRTCFREVQSTCLLVLLLCWLCANFLPFCMRIMPGCRSLVCFAPVALAASAAAFCSFSFLSLIMSVYSTTREREREGVAVFVVDERERELHTLEREKRTKEKRRARKTSNCVLLVPSRQSLLGSPVLRVEYPLEKYQNDV